MCAWKIEGDYAETCNCNLLCPCIATNMAATPTETDCKAAVAFHINKGEKDGVKLKDFSITARLVVPGADAAPAPTDDGSEG